MTREEQFTQIYERRLRGAVQRNPQGYAYPVEQVPAVARKMVAALRRGNAHISPIIRATARECGIGRPGIHSIAAWMNAEPVPADR
jgi:hypothetical protein